MSNRAAMVAKLAELETEVARAVAGGGEKYVERHHARGKLLPRERIELLVDEGSAFLELSPLAGWGSDFAVGASVVTGIGVVGDHHALDTGHHPDAGDHRGADREVGPPAGERGQLEERRPLVDEQLDPLAGQQLAASMVPVDVLLAAAGHRLRVLGVEGGDLVQHRGASGCHGHLPYPSSRAVRSSSTSVAPPPMPRIRASR